MKTTRIVLPLAAASLTAVILAGGCAPNTQALRDEPPPGAVRALPGNAMDVRLLSAKPEPRTKPPYSVADESRGRWLTLFEVTVNPIATGTLPDSGSEPNP